MDDIDERYEKGKIYLVKCKYDDTLVYVGSTINKLGERFRGHKNDNTCSLYKYVCGDWDNWYIELYEDYPCKNKYHLRIHEGDVIKRIGNINNRIAGRNINEWRLDNRDKLLEQMKQNYQNNRDNLLEQMKEYRQNNNEKIAEQKKQKVTCEICNSIVTISNFKRHKQSKQCLNKM